MMQFKIATALLVLAVATVFAGDDPSTDQECRELESLADRQPIQVRNDPAVTCETGDASVAASGDAKELIHVLHALTSQCPAVPHDRVVVFVMLNGENEGVWIEYKPGCGALLAQTAAKALKLANRVQSIPLFLYTRMGSPVSNAASTQTEQIRCSGGLLHLLLDEETWVWPGVQIGHSWHLGDVKLTTLSMHPKVLLIDNIASPEQCDQFVKEAPKPMPSPEKHYSPGFENYRTSQSAFTHGGHKTAVALRERSAWVARLPQTSWCEALQLVKYQPGQWYKKHQDYFHQYRHVGSGPKPRVQPNRHVTLFYYLNDDFEGGETVFPYARNVTASGIVREGMEECSHGLAVTPVKGSAALFYAKNGAGGLEPDSMHGGCPPVSGIKLAANAFMWNGDSQELYGKWSAIHAANAN